ncbi:MAG: hypothetical protein VKK59_00880 [Vampirovibrionales bacterium]|nr:hypothetical protein [Vampirovibrionales bacterium]
MTNFKKISGSPSNINPLQLNADGRNNQPSAKESQSEEVSKASPQATPTLSADAVMGHLTQQAQGARDAATRQVTELRLEKTMAAFSQAWSPEDHAALVGSISSVLSEAGFKPGSTTFNWLVTDSVNRYFDKVFGEPAILTS